jgi:hypothetical protein
MKHAINFMLSFLAMILLCLVYMFYWPFMYIKNRGIRAFIPTMGKHHFSLAMGIDIFGNYSFPQLWDWMFTKPGGYYFGAKGETISGALGKNQQGDKLTVTGWVMVYILWFIDVKYWKKGGHCINSIQTDQEIAAWHKITVTK